MSHRIGTGIVHRMPEIKAGQEPGINVHVLGLSCWCRPLAVAIQCFCPCDGSCHPDGYWDREHLMPSGRVVQV